ISDHTVQVHSLLLNTNRNEINLFHKTLNLPTQQTVDNNDDDDNTGFGRTPLDIKPNLRTDVMATGVEYNFLLYPNFFLVPGVLPKIFVLLCSHTAYVIELKLIRCSFTSS
ncbi:hypothetical protein STEG23_006304, partial [Scotinomys teguina]